LDTLDKELAKQVDEYQNKVIEYEAKIKVKQTEHEAERLKPKKLRNRQLGEITNEIRELRDLICRLTPMKKCPNCNKTVSYDDLICWDCGEVFFDVCPKCKSLSIHVGEWGLLECSKCGVRYRDIDLIEDLLKAGADPNHSYYNVLKSGERLTVPCYNIGIKRNTIWDLCKAYACPFEQQCEYYCPAFLAVLGLVWRGKVTTGLPWGYDQGGDLHGYKIRWKRSKWRTEEC
jgi:hypothetical protein